MATYCSWCLTDVEPQLVDAPRFARHLYQCPKCKHHVVKCRACSHYACWDKYEIRNDEGTVAEVSQHDQYCGEHRHTVANFETLNARLKEPSDYRLVFERRKRNLAKVTAMGLFAIGGLAVGGPIALYAGPAIGGFIGTTLLGLEGAAATSAGLALCGFGAKAAGGLGVAGGLTVISAFGSAVGGSLGAYIANAYFGQIQGFDVRKIRAGKGPAVVTVNGFLSSAKNTWRDWEEAIDQRFPSSPWYHVEWESKRNADLGRMVTGATAKGVCAKGLTKWAAKASKVAAKKVGPAATVAQISALATNPWHVALVKAEKTGIVLADILQRCERQEFILVGFSLGCRVVYSALRTMATTNKRRIESAHLLGGAVGNQGEEWQYAKRAVFGKIYNYYSHNDWVLQTLYKIGTFFASKPIGVNPVDAPGIRNKDVSEMVSGHMKHKESFARYAVGLR